MNAKVSKKLSRKEIEVMRAVAKGGSNKEIADTLNISINTLKTHLQHIYKKLEIKSKLELVLFYYSNTI